MNFICPLCEIQHFVSNKTLLLLKYFFVKVPQDFAFICDECGKKLESSYKDPYGLGV